MKQPTDREVRVNTQIDAFIAALLKPDRDRLEKLTSPALSYGHSSGKLENRAQFIQSMLDGVSRFLSIELDNRTISICGDVAIARHVLFAHTHDKGKEPGTIRIGILLVWRYEQDDWRLLARQAYRLPQ
ncbi:MAG TPA: nuclear transport factor 2 family protein [Gammaproteobacteria bacterium]